MNGVSFCILKTIIIIKYIVVIFTTSVLGVSGHVIIDNNEVSYERQLYEHLMADYTRSVRPVKNYSDAVHVYVNLHIYMLEDLDEVNQAFRASGSLHVTWNDFQLSWKPDEFGNVDKIRIPISKLWFPDIAVFNSLDTDKMMPNTLQLAMADNNGDVHWGPAMYFRTHCELDLTHFPFDEHYCSIRVISWSYNGLEVNISTEHWMWSAKSAEWDLVTTNSLRHVRLYACCVEPYIDLEFQMLLRRRPTFASHVFIAPSVILCLITPSVFALPPASFEKLTFGTGILIGHVLLLGELISFVPSAHPTIPLMGKFFLANIVMVSLSLAISVVVLNLWSRSKTRCVGPPSFCRTVLLHAWVARVLLVDFHDYDDDEDRGPSSAGKPEVMTDIGAGDSVSSGVTDDRARIIDQSVRAAAKSDWRRLAVVIDRFFFVLFAVIMIVTCLAFTGYL